MRPFPVGIAALTGLLLASSTQLLAQSDRVTLTGVAGQVPATREAADGNVRKLSLEEALRLALEQNLGLQVQRLDPQIQDLWIAQARASWAPTLATSFSTTSQSQPGQSAILPTAQNNLVATGLTVNESLPWGATYSAAWNNQRETTTNVLSNFSPLLLSTLNVNYTQPLLRNFSIDPIRRQLALSQKARDLSDISLQSMIVETNRNVKYAYWDLVYAFDSLQVRQQTSALAQQSLRDNQRRVELGTMAPVDIVESEAEVARNAEQVIVAEAAVRSAEDRLRVLIFDPAVDDLWSTSIEPSDTAPFEERSIDVDAAVARALSDRTDLRQARNSLQQGDINVRFYKNQLLPDVTLSIGYGALGVGGTELTPADLSLSTTGTVLSRSIVAERGYGSVLGDVLRSEYAQWSVGVQIGYPLGARPAQANAARARLQYQQAETELKNLELQAVLHVREAARQVDTARKRVLSARASAALQERKLEAEQRKEAAGTSTTFFVIQAQRDLAQARTLEIQAVADYNKSLATFEAVQESSTKP